MSYTFEKSDINIEQRNGVTDYSNAADLGHHLLGDITGGVSSTNLEIPKASIKELLSSAPKTQDLSAPLPDSLIARAGIFGEAAVSSLPKGILQSLTGVDHVQLPYSEKIFGHKTSIPVPTILENAAVGAAIGFAAKTILPETGFLGKVGSAVLGGVFMAPLANTGIKIVNDTRLANSVNQLQFAGSELGTSVGSFAASLPVGVGAYNFGAGMAGKLMASKPMLPLADAKVQFYNKMNNSLASGIDASAEALKNALGVNATSDPLKIPDKSNILLHSLNQASAAERAPNAELSDPIKIPDKPATTSDPISGKPSGGINEFETSDKTRTTIDALLPSKPINSFRGAKPSDSFIGAKPGDSFLSSRPGDPLLSSKPGDPFLSPKPGDAFKIPDKPTINFDPITGKPSSFAKPVEIRNFDATSETPVDRSIRLVNAATSDQSPLSFRRGHDALFSGGIPIAEDTRGAMENVTIQGMHPARRQQAVLSTLAYTYPDAKALYGMEDLETFQRAQGEMVRALTPDQVNNAMSMYQISGQQDLNSPMGRQFMGAAAKLAETSSNDFATAYKSLIAVAPQVAKRIYNNTGLFLASNQELGQMQSLSDLAARIVPEPGQSIAGTMDRILYTSSKQLSWMATHNIPLKTVADAEVAPEVVQAISSITKGVPGGLESVQGSRALDAVARNLSTPFAPHTAPAIEAMYTYAKNGGDPAQLDLARIAIATRAYNEVGAGGVTPHTIEVALNQGYAEHPGSIIPWDNVQKTALNFENGQFKDYKMSTLMRQLADHNIPVSRNNLQMAVETIASNNGAFDPDLVRAVIRVGTELSNAPADAPIILENFARAEASRLGINTAKMNLSQVLNALKSADPMLTATNVAQNTIQLTRAGAGFNINQLADPLTVDLLVNGGGTHEYAPQAINVVTKVVGSGEAMNHPEYVHVIEEYLDNGGKMNDVTLSTLNTAVHLSEMRGKALSQTGPLADAAWNNVRINPEALRLIQRDPSYSVSNTQNPISDALADTILRAAANGPRPRK